MRSDPLKIGVFLFLAGFLSPGLGASAWAEASGDGGGKAFDSFTVYWENDLFGGTDGGYTNGVRFTWSTPYRPAADASRQPEWLRNWYELLPGSSPAEGRAVSLSLGQSIYTPVDIERADPDPNDRPYAGYSYLAAAFHSRRAEVKTTWEVQAGVVGPQAYAEEAQDFFHDWAGINRAKGWDHQLNNEPTLEIIGERQWLLLHGELGQGFGYDFIPHLGGQLGNVAVLANLGGELRWGWRLPHRFGTCTIRGGCENISAFGEAEPPLMALRSCYLFAGGDGRWVLRNIFLDGNTFTDSPSVERKPLVAELVAGISAQYWVTQLTCAAVYRTKEFETQERNESFGSFSLSLLY